METNIILSAADTTDKMVVDAIYNIHGVYSGAPEHCGIHVYLRRTNYSPAYRVLIDVEAAGMWVRYNDNYNWIKVLG